MVEVEVNTIQGNENSSTLHRLLMKRTARSCKRIDNYQARNRNASRLFNHFSIKPDARTNDSNTASIREVENAMRTLRGENSSTVVDSLIRISPLTSNISYGNSSFQEGTPISKTKRPERHKFHCWISKIQVHKRRRAFNKLRKTNGTACNDDCEPHKKMNYNFNDDENKEFENDVYVKNFPNEAFSCYNQFKTTDFSDIFNGSFFDKCSSDNNNNNNNNNLEINSYNTNHHTGVSEAANEVDIPLFSPINELTYENLQILREQIFGLPPFSADSEINVEELSRMPSIIEVDSSDGYDKGGTVELPATADIEDHSDQTQQTKRSTDFSESQVYNLPTPEIIKQLFVDTTVRMKDTFEIESSQLDTMINKLDDIVVENYSSELTPIEAEDQAISEDPKSLFQTVKQAFKNENHGDDMSSNSSGSTYSPVTVIVPALKPNHTLIAGLAQNVSEGYKIEPVYHAEDLGNDSADDENTLMDIRNASSYESHSTAQTSLAIGKTTSCETHGSDDLTVNSTIKFNEFAQLLVYDGSRRSKYQENSTLDLDQHQKRQYNSQNHITDIIRAGSISKAFSVKKHHVMKNNGTLALGSAAFGKSKRLRNLQLAQFSKFVTSPIDKESVENACEASENESIRSILKSKHNRNAETESIRARYCDDIEVGEFMVFFENYERQRIETEPILNRIRERQLLQYYDTEDEMADGYSSDESTDQYDP